MSAIPKSITKKSFACKWGPDGPKGVIDDILAGLDQDSILSAARQDILARLKLQTSSE